VPNIQIGDLAPDISIETTDGLRFDLRAPEGRYRILYFYPKDDTPGCTVEAKAFSDQLSAFSEAKADVVGISRDSAKSHEKFRVKHALSVPLMSDDTGRVTEAFGVWVEKSMYGKAYMGIERATFLIGLDGKILRQWRKVKVQGHVHEVLTEVHAQSAAN
jgi:thioredoxin-dependent peroxiredoxin